MSQIVIETAKFCADKGFAYMDWQTFPPTAKGLTLAVIAAERMMQIDPYHIPHADIRISFKDGQQPEQLDDAQMFDMIATHRAGFPILDKCGQIIDARAVAVKAPAPVVSIERTNKLKIARAAVEDLIEAGFSVSYKGCQTHSKCR